MKSIIIVTNRSSIHPLSSLNMALWTVPNFNHPTRHEWTYLLNNLKSYFLLLSEENIALKLIMYTVACNIFVRAEEIVQRWTLFHTNTFFSFSLLYLVYLVFTSPCLANKNEYRLFPKWILNGCFFNTKMTSNTAPSKTTLYHQRLLRKKSHCVLPGWTLLYPLVATS